ncbi:phage tail protein [Microvirga yunnanensis]|uniref:phage tail protein n=1 Tax=Microvirga yunnanensis TaxID=2953740 RepID=UPI0021CA65E4|nr:phage tail protein [Microvirga sp. HBU65207]
MTTNEDGHTKKDDDLKYGGPKWSEQLRFAIREAIAEAVAEHQKKGNPVYFTDDAGCLCVMMPDNSCRRLSQGEVADLNGL